MAILGKVIAILCLAVVVGCATTPSGPLAPEALKRVKRVAVVSVTAETFYRTYVGFTVFGNEHESKAIADWNVDRAYEEQLSAALARLSRLTVVRGPAASREFLRVNESEGMSKAPNWAFIETVAKNHCGLASVDALLVIAARSGGDVFGASNQSIAGAGIYVRGPALRTSVLHLQSQLAVIDCVTGRPLAIRDVTKNSAASMQIPAGAVAMPIPTDISTKPITQWSEDVQYLLRRDLAALPADAWAHTLKSIFPDIW